MVDLTLCCFATSFAFYLRLGEWIPLVSVSEWMPLIALQISIFFAIPLFVKFGLYKEIFRYSGWPALLSILKVSILYLFLYSFLITIIGIRGIPRTIGLIQPITLLLMIGLSRGVASFLLSDAYRQVLTEDDAQRIFIYGAGSAGRQLIGGLANARGIKILGLLDDNPKLHGSILMGIKIYAPNLLTKLIPKFNITQVLLAMPSVSRARRNEIIKKIKETKVGIQTVPALNDIASGKVDVKDIRSLDIDDLLGRDVVLPDPSLLILNSHKKVVMITGAGGSIGSELCRQILQHSPEKLVLIDQSEYALYKIYEELKRLQQNYSEKNIVPVLASVTNIQRMREIVSEHMPDIIYHSAAYKHVPLVEINQAEGVRNNSFGTLTLACIASELSIERFMLISTDKSVRPTNVMGASKRLAEMILQSLSESGAKTIFSMVRFGNVLNSSGSVIPLFEEQIKNGGPITVTDFRMTRYFMTIPEAAQLVIQASALAKGGDLFLLDMGAPVKILDLANKMVELSGLKVKDHIYPNGDIEIIETGLRPGEKLYEELLIEGSPDPTIHPRIFKARDKSVSWDVLDGILKEIKTAIDNNNNEALRRYLITTINGYKPLE